MFIFPFTNMPKACKSVFGLRLSPDPKAGGIYKFKPLAGDQRISPGRVKATRVIPHPVNYISGEEPHQYTQSGWVRIPLAVNHYFGIPSYRLPIYFSILRFFKPGERDLQINVYLKNMCEKRPSARLVSQTLRLMISDPTRVFTAFDELDASKHECPVIVAPEDFLTAFAIFGKAFQRQSSGMEMPAIAQLNFHDISEDGRSARIEFCFWDSKLFGFEVKI